MGGVGKGSNKQKNIMGTKISVEMPKMEWAKNH
jgi:hypothetical protein